MVTLCKWAVLNKSVTLKIPAFPKLNVFSKRLCNLKKNAAMEDGEDVVTSWMRLMPMCMSSTSWVCVCMCVWCVCVCVCVCVYVFMCEYPGVAATSGDTAHVCACGKSFRMRGDLTRHKRICTVVGCCCPLAVVPSHYTKGTMYPRILLSSYDEWHSRFKVYSSRAHLELAT